MRQKTETEVQSNYHEGHEEYKQAQKEIQRIQVKNPVLPHGALEEIEL